MAVGQPLSSLRLQVDLLDQILNRLDAFDAMAVMLFANQAGFMGSTPGKPLVAPRFACEYVCLRLLGRETIAAPHPGGEVAVEELVLHAETAAYREAYSVIRNPEDPTGFFETDSRRRFELLQLAFYDPAMPELEADRWPQLFAPVAAPLEAVTGLSIDGLEQLVDSLWMHSILWCLYHAQAESQPDDPAEVQRLLHAAVRRGRGTAVEPGSGRLLAGTREQLAKSAGVTAHEVEAFLALFATRPPVDPTRFSKVVWDFRRRPVVLWDDRIILPVPFDLIMAIRPTLEAVLRDHDPKASGRYDLAKGKWVERQALDLLGRLLEPDQAFRSLKVAAPEAGQTDPEHDGLLRVDMVAIAAEAKGGGVSLSARRGRADSQDETMKRLVHEGVAQADGLIAALQVGEPVTGIDLATQHRVVVDIGAISRWIPLVVTLEDMSGVVAGSRRLFAERDPAQPHPIVLTLDDLVWFARELPLHAQVIHYLVVRERIAQSTSRLTVFDEADLFLTYLAAGGTGVQRLLDGLAKINVPILGTGGSGRRGVPDPNLTPWRSPFEKLLERWRAERTDGWLEASMAILDLDEAQANDLRYGLTEARKEAARTDDPATMVIRPRGDPSVSLQIGIPSRSDEIALEEAGSVFAHTAPHATSHVLLHAPTDDPDDLQLHAIVTLRVVGEASPNS